MTIAFHWAANASGVDVGPNPGRWGGFAHCWGRDTGGDDVCWLSADASLEVRFVGTATGLPVSGRPSQRVEREQKQSQESFLWIFCYVKQRISLLFRPFWVGILSLRVKSILMVPAWKLLIWICNMKWNRDSNSSPELNNFWKTFEPLRFNTLHRVPKQLQGQMKKSALGIRTHQVLEGLTCHSCG